MLVDRPTPVLSLLEKVLMCGWQAAYLLLILLGFRNFEQPHFRSWLVVLFLGAIAVDGIALLPFVLRPTGDESTGPVAFYYLVGKIGSLAIFGQTLTSRIRRSMAASALGANDGDRDTAGSLK